ncbi:MULTISPECIES: ABC transporter permease [unclassified Micromonospora]|uniref:ABC transporter permease n=1 Tax=unclassified Micromonospora TaxID=2617518 RepID=UPI00362D4446
MILRALVRAALLLVGVSVLVFAATEALPGDAADARTAGRATATQLAEMRASTGLDVAPWHRYLRWAAGLLQGEAGVSSISGRPVTDLIGQRLPATAALAGAALLVAVPLMLVLAWPAAEDSVAGRLVGAMVTATAAIPQVVVAAALTALFAGVLAWLPPVSLLPADGGPPGLPALALPALSLALPAAAYGAMLLRGLVTDVLARPYVRDARLRGLAPSRIALVYVGPFVVAPAIRILAVVTGGLIAATAVVEVMFGYAGLGELLVGAVANRDVPVVQAGALLAAAAVVLGLLAADVAAALTDPRRAAA